MNTILLAIFAIALGQVSPLPNPKFTPGAMSSMVSQANIQWTICSPGWAKLARPRTEYTNKIKRMVMDQYGYPWGERKKFELDHLVPIELGGDPVSPSNLWPELWRLPVGDDNHDLGAHTKDSVENFLKREVCAHRLTLQEAQQSIAGNWIAVYERMPKKKR